MKTIATILVLFLAFTGNAQISLGGVKKKAKSTIESTKSKKKNKSEEPTEKEKTTKGSSSTSQSNATLTPEEQEKEEIRNSPAKSLIWDFKSEMNFLRSTIQKKGPRCTHCEKDLKKLEGILMKIKETDPNFSGYDKRATELEKWKDKYSRLVTGEKYRQQLFSLKINCQVYLKEPWEVKNLKHFNRLEFNKKKEEILASSLTEEDRAALEKSIAEIEDFYDNQSDKIIANLLEDLTENYGRCSFWKKENREKPGFYDTFNSTKDIKDDLNWSKELIPFAKLCLNFQPKNAEFKVWVEKAEELHEDLTAFQESGEYDELIARKKADELAAVRMERPKNTNGSLIAIIKKKVNTVIQPGEKIQRVVIYSTSWGIRKNDLGIPLHKFMYVQIALKRENGNCYITEGELYKAYEGGGTYGPTKFSYDRYSSNYQILCENVNK